jgi:hypothetical protein
MAIEVAKLQATLGLAKEGFDKGIDGASNKLRNFGSGFGKLAVGVGAGGIAALGLAIGKVGLDSLGTAQTIEEAAAQMQAALGVTEEQAQSLADTGVAVFKNNFGASIGDASAAVALVATQLKTLPADQLQTATENAYRLSDAFGVDLNESLNAVDTLMQQFGLTQQQSFDFLTTGFQRGLNSSGDFVDSIGEYSNLFAQNGADASQFFSVLETGLQGGMLGTDKAADAFKEFGVRLVDGSKTSSEALSTVFGYFMDTSEAIEKTSEEVDKLTEALAKAENAKTPNLEKIANIKDDLAKASDSLEFFQAQNGKFVEGIVEFDGGVDALFAGISDGAITTVEAFDMVQGALSQVDDPLQQSSLGVALMGTQFEDLGANAVAGISTATTSMDDLAGTTEGLDAQYETLSAKFESLQRSAETALAPIGEILLGALETVIPKVQEFLGWMETDGVPAVANFMTGLNDAFAGFTSAEGEGGIGAELTSLKTTWETAMADLAESDALNRISEAFGRITEVLGIEPGDIALDWIKEEFAKLEVGIQAGVFVIESLATAMEKIATNVEKADKFWGQFKQGLSGIEMPEAIQNMIDKFNDLAGAIPSWLIPGSPPPLYFAFQDINRALNQAPDISAQYGFAQGAGRVLPVPALAETGMGQAGSGEVIEVHNHIYLDGQLIETQVSKRQGKRQRDVEAMGGPAKL